VPLAAFLAAFAVGFPVLYAATFGLWPFSRPQYGAFAELPLTPLGVLWRLLYALAAGLAASGIGRATFPARPPRPAIALGLSLLALLATGPLRTLVASIRGWAGPPAGGDEAVGYELTAGLPPWEPLAAEFAPLAALVAVGASLGVWVSSRAR
jgi:hypothetical protein